MTPARPAPLLCMLTLLASSIPSLAADWPQWRGPDFTGGSPETGLPATFSKTGNVKWKADLPGPAGSSPVVVGDNVFLTAAVEADQQVLALCLDAASGAVRWSKPFAKGFRGDRNSNFAGPSPACDGKSVVFFAGTGDLATFDFAGKELWHRNVQNDYGRFAFLWTFSTSPVLHNGRLFLQVLQRNSAFQAHGAQKGEPDGKNESFILALDPTTGKEQWRVVRPSEAVSESLESFTTPVPATVGGRPQLLVAGGDCVSGHDPATGAELWRWGTWNPTRIGHWRLVPSPVTSGENILACAPKGAPVYAVKAGLRGPHTDESALAWRSKLSDEDLPSPAYKNVSSDVATPAFHRDHYYIVNGEKQTVACVKAATGEVRWHEPLGGRTKIEASPSIADGKLYIMDHRGDVYVVGTDPEQFQSFGKAEMGEDNARSLRATIAIAGKRLFVRTDRTLWCIGN